MSRRALLPRGGTRRRAARARCCACTATRSRRTCGRVLVERAAGAGWHALAPDLPGYGDSPPDPPHTWQRMVDAVDRFHDERADGPVALCVHDWGGLIGLRWACDHPDKVRALVISRERLLPRRQVARPGQGDADRGRGRGDRRRHDARGLRPDARRGRAGHRRAGARRVLQGLRRPRAPPRPARALPLGRLRRARALSRAGWPPSACRRCCSSAPRTRSRASPRRIAWRKEIPHARTEVLDGIGHFMFDEVPDRAAAIVVDFLDALV